MSRSSSRRFLSLLALLLLGVPVLDAQSVTTGRVECGAMTSKYLEQSVRYCVLLPASYDAQPERRYPVLYYLHGLGDNEQTMVNSGGWNLIERLQKEGRIGDFLIATPDGGGSFYINSQDGNVRYGDFFLHEFIPTIEKRYRIRSQRASRGISGMSMGGYGALHHAFEHPELFGSVSAHAAALMEELPQGIDSSGATDRRIRVLGQVFGSPIDRDYYRRNSPFTLARRNGLNGLKIYFDCGLSDDYGFDAGARALDRLLSERGIEHEFHLFPGGHDWLYLMQNLDESLEFHWKIFAAAK